LAWSTRGSRVMTRLMNVWLNPRRAAMSICRTRRLFKAAPI
jgi:hypothetical protein